MAQKIQIKRSGTTGVTPAVAELDYGELAINYADGKLFYKKDASTVEEISGSGSGGGFYEEVFSDSWLATPTTPHITIDFSFITGTGASALKVYDLIGYTDYGVADSLKHYKLYIHQRSKGTTDNTFEVQVVQIQGGTTTSTDSIKFWTGYVASGDHTLYLDLPENYSGFKLVKTPLASKEKSDNDITITRVDTALVTTGLTSVTVKDLQGSLFYEGDSSNRIAHTSNTHLVLDPNKGLSFNGSEVIDSARNIKNIKTVAAEGLVKIDNANGWDSNAAGSKLLRLDGADGYPSMSFYTDGTANWTLYKGGSGAWVGDGNIGFVHHSGAEDSSRVKFKIDTSGNITASGTVIGNEAQFGDDGTNGRLTFNSDTTQTTIHSTTSGFAAWETLRFRAYDYKFLTGSTTERVRIATNGDVSFYEDTGTTAKMVWDASAEALGIGTSSPARELEVTGTGNVYVRVTAPTGNDSTALELVNTGETWTIANDDTNSDALEFRTTGGTHLTVDTTGKTKITSSGTIGLTTPGNGYLQITDNTNTLAFDPNEILASNDLNIGTKSGDIDFRPSTGNVVVYASNGTDFDTITEAKIGNWDTAYTWANTAPAAPSITSTNLIGETIEIVFSESTTSEVDRYEIWGNGGGSSYSLIGIIPETDIASSMSFVDATFNEVGTIGYRVYAVRKGVYSTASTTTQAFSTPSLDVVNLRVVSDLNTFHVEYDKPDTRFLDHIEIYVDTDASSSGTARASAVLAYSGDETSYTHNISSSQRDHYHQFWVECVGVS